MNATMLRNIESKPLNGLQSTRMRGNVGSLNAKPSERTEGLAENLSNLHRMIDDGETDTPIIQEMPDLYKHNGIPMSKIPFSFIPFPSYFFTSGWIDLNGDPKKLAKRMKFLHWALKKCSATTKKVVFDGKMVVLEPYQFICGRDTSSKECNLTPGEFRNQLNLHQNAKIVEKATSSVTSRYSVYTLITDGFPENHNQLNNQNYNQLNNQLNNHKLERRTKTKDLRETIAVESTDRESSLLDSEDFREYNALWDLIKKYEIDAENNQLKKPGITEKDLQGWMKKYSSNEIHLCLKKVSKCEVKKTYAAAVNYYLKNEIPRKEQLNEQGKEAVKKAIEQNKMTHIKMLKDYFVDEMTGDQMKYSLPKDTLMQFLSASWSRSMKHELDEQLKKDYEKSGLGDIL